MYSLDCGKKSQRKVKGVKKHVVKKNVHHQDFLSVLKRGNIYCYGEYQQSFRKYSNVEFRQGLPDASDFDGSEPVLLMIEDLMQETDGTVANLFTKGSHHRNVSVVFLAQNLFPKNKFARTMSKFNSWVSDLVRL